MGIANASSALRHLPSYTIIFLQQTTVFEVGGTVLFLKSFLIDDQGDIGDSRSTTNSAVGP